MFCCASVWLCLCGCVLALLCVCASERVCVRVSVYVSPDTVRGDLEAEVWLPFWRLQQRLALPLHGMDAWWLQVCMCC